jgi:hypothetical protein
VAGIESEGVMRVKVCLASLFAAVIALSVLPVAPADAAQKQKKAAAKKTAVAKAPSARVTVQRRSFLDAGTHVLPGDRKFTDYVMPPGYSPTSVIDNRAGSWRSPLPGPFDLPSPHNPWPWHW